MYNTLTGSSSTFSSSIAAPSVGAKVTAQSVRHMAQTSIDNTQFLSSSLAKANESRSQVDRAFIADEFMFTAELSAAETNASRGVGDMGWYLHGTGANVSSSISYTAGHPGVVRVYPDTAISMVPTPNNNHNVILWSDVAEMNWVFKPYNAANGQFFGIADTVDDQFYSGATTTRKAGLCALTSLGSYWNVIVDSGGGATWTPSTKLISASDWIRFRMTKSQGTSVTTRFYLDDALIYEGTVGWSNWSTFGAYAEGAGSYFDIDYFNMKFHSRTRD